MDLLDALRHTIGTRSQKELDEMIPRGALKLSEEQVATVSFVFWLVYMAEIDLNKALKDAMHHSESFFSEEVNEFARNNLRAMVGDSKITCPSCSTTFPSRKIDVVEPVYFSDKIKVYQALGGKTARASFLWKLNDLRNDLSHNRIEDFKYEGASLSDRSTKEKIVLDYFESVSNSDLSQSKVWNDLTTEEQEQVLDMFDRLREEYGRSREAS